MTLLICLQRVNAAVTGAVAGNPARFSKVGTLVATVASMAMSKALCQ